MKEKALVLYSGGLDSRLTIKLMKENYEVEALNFKLPFGCSCKDNDAFEFLKKEKVPFHIIDITKSPLLEEYLKIIKDPCHGIGASLNPCSDCKIFMFKIAKNFADKNNIRIIATGEVKGQRPMSQTKQRMELIDRKIGFQIKRPLTELGISGRKRDKQMQLAEKYKINYPTPSGGCLLCEKNLKNRFQKLFEKNLLNDKNIDLIKIGRHFLIENSWIIVARNEKESEILEKYENSIPSYVKTPAIYFNNKKDRSLAKEIQELFVGKKTEKIEKLRL
jgi:tRNA-specific 2-thiouridylase